MKQVLANNNLFYMERELFNFSLQCVHPGNATSFCQISHHVYLTYLYIVVPMIPMSSQFIQVGHTLCRACVGLNRP